MSHTNSTTNYALPQFLTTDKPFWLTDINQAFSAIDSAMKNNADTATSAGNNAVQALSDASAASSAAATADAKGAGAIASISDTFDATSLYALGDIVIYNNLLYKCISAVTTPGAWTGAANWERTTVETLIDTANASIATLNSQLYSATTPAAVSASVAAILDRGAINIRKVGKIVTANGLYRSTRATGPNNVIFTLNDVTPLLNEGEQVFFPVTVESASFTPNVSYAYIDNTGSIIDPHPITDGNLRFFNFTFCIQ